MTAATGVVTGFARVRGSFRDPWLEVHIHPRLSYPLDRRLTMVDWAKSLRGRWDPSSQSWSISGLNSLRPEETLASAGIELRWDEREGELEDIAAVDELVAPIAKLSADGRTVLVRHRLAGFEKAKEILGSGAVWDAERRLFRVHVGDVLVRDRSGAMIPRPSVHWPDDAVDLAEALHDARPVDEGLADLAAWLASALDVDSAHPDDLALIGRLPEQERALFPFQQAGAYAVAAGRTCLFDEPGVGKTATSLAAARMLQAERVIIVCPPLLTTNWSREAVMAGFPQPTVIRAGRKEPELPVPSPGQPAVVIVPDALLAARPGTLARMREWQADVMLVDEAHRIKTIGSKRGEAVLSLGVTVKHAPVAISGTPIFASPHELVPLLELTRTICPVFGGRAQFLDDFSRQDRFGGWHAKKGALPRMRETLIDEVWVRRRKKDVLPQLPPKRRRELIVDVPLAEYRATHKEVISKIVGWVSWFVEHHHRMPDTSDCEEYAQASSFELIAMLRRAAGLAKIAAAKELIAAHLENNPQDEDGTWPSPLIVWAHHLDVIVALREAAGALTGVKAAAAIYGPTRDAERDAIVDAFQEGRVPVLIGGITKAGVGLTLTASSEAFFAETDWTPALMKQAEDRNHRIGQVNPSNYTTLIASGTLDEPIQRVLIEKTAVLEAALGDTDDSVAVLRRDETNGLTEIAMLLIGQAILEYQKKAPKTAAKA